MIKLFVAVVSRSSKEFLYCDCSARFVFAGRPSKRCKLESRASGQNAGGTDATANAASCWTHAARKAVRQFYSRDMDPAELMDFVHDVTSHRSGDGWSHGDILRLVHPIPASDGQTSKSLMFTLVFPHELEMRRERECLQKP
jgi:hypothetical protein